MVGSLTFTVQRLQFTVYSSKEREMKGNSVMRMVIMCLGFGVRILVGWRLVIGSWLLVSGLKALRQQGLR
jgi:hypothetical protein